MSIILSDGRPCFGEESTTREFKTSLFFRAGINVPCEDQIDVITRVIASFINAEGGDLFIGVNDAGFPTSSIRDEYQYMNSFPPFNKNRYPSNKDGYKRFICDWISRKLGNLATTFISFEFKVYDSIEICKIHIKASKTPVWFDNSSLYVRTDGATRQLRGNDITGFILNIDRDELLKSNMDSNALAAKRLEQIKSETRSNGRILVVYPDGTYVHEKSNVDTLLQVIRRAGINEVINLGLVGRSGKGDTPSIPFIGNDVYLTGPDKSNKSQRELDGYMVFTKYSAGDMLAKITQISNGLGLGIHVEVF